MFRQLDWEPATEHFIPQAVLNKTPSFFEAERRITFTSSYDNLDYFKAALLAVGSGTRFLLKQYRGARPSTTTIYLSPENQGIEYITRTVHEIVSSLDLTDSDVLWERKDNPEA